MGEPELPDGMPTYAATLDRALREGGAFRLACIAEGTRREITVAADSLVATAGAGQGSIFRVVARRGSTFTLADERGRTLGLGQTPTGPALVLLDPRSDRKASPLGLHLDGDQLGAVGRAGSWYLSRDPRVGLHRLVHVGGVSPASMAPALVPAKLVAVPEASILPGLHEAAGGLPAGTEGAPAPSGLAVAPLVSEADRATRTDYVIALVRDGSGATRAGVPVRLLEGDRVLDQAFTTHAGVALLFWGEPSTDERGMVTLEIPSSSGMSSILFEPAPDGAHTVVEAIVDGFPEEVGAPDDPFSRLPLHHMPALSEDLLRWTGPQSSGLGGEDVARSRFATRRWSFARTVEIPRRTKRRHLVIVRQTWTHVGDALGELVEGTPLVPGVSTTLRGRAREDAAEARASSESGAWRGLGGSWERAWRTDAPSREANEQAHAVASTGTPDGPPEDAAHATLDVVRQPPLPGVVANVYKWQVRSRFAVRSRVHDVLDVVPVALPPARELFTPQAIASVADLLAPALPEARRREIDAFVDNERMRSLGAVGITRIVLQASSRASHAGANLIAKIGGTAHSAPIPAGSSVVRLHLDIPETPLERVTRLTLGMTSDAVTLRRRGAAEDPDLAALSALLDRHASADAARRVQARIERATLLFEDADGEVARADVPLPDDLAVEGAIQHVERAVDVPQPTRASPRALPLLRFVEENAAALAAFLVVRARDDLDARDRVSTLLRIAPDDPLWSERIVGVESGALLVARPCAEDDEVAAHWRSDPGDATVVSSPTPASFTDLVVGEDHAGLLEALSTGDDKSLLGSLLPPIPAVPSAEVARVLDQLPDVTGLADQLPTAAATDIARGVTGALPAVGRAIPLATGLGPLRPPTLPVAGSAELPAKPAARLRKPPTLPRTGGLL